MRVFRKHFGWTLLASTLFCGNAAAQNKLGWADYLDSAEINSFVRDVTASIVFDDGTGDRLFVGGNFTKFGGIDVGCVFAVDTTDPENNGRHISTLDGGFDGWVEDFAVYDGTLYACGSFVQISNGSVTAHGIATWDGVNQTWLPVMAGDPPVPTGFAGFADVIYSMAVYQSELYVGGDISDFYTNSTTSIPTKNLAKWDGSGWTVFADGPNGPIEAMEPFGGDLYIGGNFAEAFGKTNVNNIIKWNGTLGSKMGTAPNVGVQYQGSGPGAAVLCMQVYDDGMGGDDLYIGGYFDKAGAVVLADRDMQGDQWGIAMWTPGGAWAGIIKGAAYMPSFEGSVLGVTAMVVAPFGPPGGPASTLIVAGKNTANRLSRPPLQQKGWEDRFVLTWDGTAWESFGSHLSARSPQLEPNVAGGSASPYTLSVYNGAVYFAEFLANPKADGTLVDGTYLVRYDWTENSKTNVGGGFAGTVFDFIIYDFESGDQLVAGGDFRAAALDPDIDDPSALMVAVWDPAAFTWKPMMDGLAPVNVPITHGVVHGGLGQPHVYDRPGLTQFLVHGGALWASGSFIDEESQILYGLAEWNPTTSSWDLQGVLDSVGSLHSGQSIKALASYGGKLYAVPTGISLPGLPGKGFHNGLVVWNGMSWELPPQQKNLPKWFISLDIQAMEIFENELYIGGLLDDHSGLARLGETTYTQVGYFDGSGASVLSLAVGDPDGTGTAFGDILIVGGYIDGVGVDSKNVVLDTVGIAQLYRDGSNNLVWAALDKGLIVFGNPFFSDGFAQSLHFGPDVDDPTMLVLYAGGSFDRLDISPMQDTDALNFGAYDFVTGKWRGAAVFGGGILEAASGLNVLAIEHFNIAPEWDGVFVGGSFTTVGSVQSPQSSGNVAIWIHANCYADCNDDGVFDTFDFLCFQDAFVNGEPYACDCDTSTGVGVCDIFDFLCFQNAFVAGCPGY